MKQKIVSLLLLLLLLICETAEATTVNEYKKLSENEQKCFLVGAVEGMGFSTFALSADKENHWFIKCYEKMEFTQVEAIFKKYINEHPEKWHFSVISLLVESMSEACEKRGDTN
jgi:hypothetical protein|tara:strand:- start:447 stop:788 length:342 start_codon:yes stop_codon:yes gene_type:complete